MAEGRDHLEGLMAYRADRHGRTTPACGSAKLSIDSDPAAAGAGGSAGNVELPPALLITDVRSFAEGLRAAMARGDVAIDAAKLKDIDTAGLQLLCATRAAALAAGKTFRWTSESDGLRKAATAVGLTGILGLAA